MNLNQKWDRIFKENFKCISFLEKGNFSKIYKVKCIKSIPRENFIENDYYTIKTLDSLYPEYNEKFKISIRNEYNISKFFDCVFLRKSTSIYNNIMFLEYCEGYDLFETLNFQVYSDKDKLNIYSQVLEGIKYMHNLGIAHCDIKMENIIVNFNKQVKIIDFADSKYFRNTKTNEIILSNAMCGTVQFISPESLQYKRHDPEKDDIWACGILLYELICDRLLWKRAVVLDKNYELWNTYHCENDINSKYLFLRDLNGHYEPRVFKDILISMLCVNPNDRISINEVSNIVKSLI